MPSLSRYIFILLTIIVVMLTGCGGGTAHSSTHVASPSCHLAAGHGHLGACVTQPTNPFERYTARHAHEAAGARYIFDAYEGEGAEPWNLAPRFLSGVVVKAQEYREDYRFTSNWQGLQRAHIWHSAYVFVRNIGCIGQADAFVSDVRRAGGFDSLAGPPVIDAEVPEAYGLVPCLANRIRQDTGIKTIVTYTACGTWAGGGHDSTLLWVAAYGSSPCFSSLWTTNAVAWQYTDGQFGPSPHCVGPFCGDLSLDWGFTGLLAHPTPPDPYAIFPKTRFQLPFGKTAVEHNVIPSWDSHHCRNPVIRQVCKSDRFLMQLLRDRAIFVATHKSVQGHWVKLLHPRWNFNNLGARTHGMQLRLTRR